MNKSKSIVLGIVAVVAVCAVAVAVYLGGWALSKDSKNRSREVMTGSNQYVASQSDAIRTIATAVAAVDVDIAKAQADATLDPAVRDDLVASLRAQRISLVNDGCATVDTIGRAVLTPAIASFASIECR